jgi:hypothetical protein
MEISLIPHGQISYVLPKVLEHLNTSVKWARGRITLDDLVSFLVSGRNQLWVIFDKDTLDVYGQIVTEIVSYPQKKMLVIQYCAARTGTMEQIDAKVHETMHKFAKDTGCNGIEFVGRSGWSRQAKQNGYEVESVKYQKFFEEAQK